MQEHPVEIDDFATRARDFLAWCEHPHDVDNVEAFQLASLSTLASLYAAALLLPGVEFREAPEPPVLSPDRRVWLAHNLKALPFRYYWEVFTPTDAAGDKEPVCGDLFDDFLDIYGDVSQGLWLYDQGHLEAAVFTWWQMFGFHWGRHAVSAMHALHSFDSSEGVRSNKSLERTREV